MTNQSLKKPLDIAVGATFVAAMSAAPIASADANPFGMQSLESGYLQVAEGKCGEGKCGGSMKSKHDGKCGGKKKMEGKCGEGKKGMKEGKCGEGKCGGKKKMEGKCGEGKAKHDGTKKMEGKCGEGKCGGKR
jgi:uncharacterized low-complexity protein